MRHLTYASVLMLALAAGCSDGEKKPDDGSPPPRKAQPARATTTPQKAPAETTDTGDDGPIKIKGSRHGDSSSAVSAQSSEAERQRKIQELKDRAKESEGKDNGQPYREGTDPKAAESGSKKERIKARVTEIDQQVSKLQDEKEAMHHRTHPRRGTPTESWDDPERAKAIDVQVEDLKKEKDFLNRKLVEMEISGEGDPPKHPPAK